MLARPFPRPALIAAGLLIVATIITAAVVRYYIGVDTFPPTATVLASRDLRFEDRPDGSIAVTNATDGALVQMLAPGSNGFIRATLRGIVRERKLEDIGQAPPFRLTAYADGRLTLEDLATGRRIDLEAFGHTNLAAFTRLLPLPGATP
jgi:putative photosynthetic complex assembly protein